MSELLLRKDMEESYHGLISKILYYTHIFLEGLRKTQKNLCQDSRSSGRYFNSGSLNTK
jgi:hypothetical protein